MPPWAPTTTTDDDGQLLMTKVGGVHRRRGADVRQARDGCVALATHVVTSPLVGRQSSDWAARGGTAAAAGCRWTAWSRTANGGSVMVILAGRTITGDARAQSTHSSSSAADSRTHPGPAEMLSYCDVTPAGLLLAPHHDPPSHPATTTRRRRDDPMSASPRRRWRGNRRPRGGMVRRDGAATTLDVQLRQPVLEHPRPSIPDDGTSISGSTSVERRGISHSECSLRPGGITLETLGTSAVRDEVSRPPLSSPSKSLAPNLDGKSHSEISMTNKFSPSLSPCFTLGSALRWLGYDEQSSQCLPPIHGLTASVWFLRRRGQDVPNFPLETLLVVVLADTGASAAMARRMVGNVNRCTGPELTVLSQDCDVVGPVGDSVVDDALRPYLLTAGRRVTGGPHRTPCADTPTLQHLSATSATVGTAQPGVGLRRCWRS